MNSRRASAQRLSEFGDFLIPNPSNNRKSRLDGSVRSFIPRPSGRSLERLSGVQPLDSGIPQGPYAHHGPSTSTSASRHRSAESGRMTQQFNRPRAESAQRPSSQSRPRSTLMMVRGTPSQTRTPLARTLLQTPMSAAMMQSRPRTPSSERCRGRLVLLEKGALAMPGKDKRQITDARWQKATCERVVQYLLSHSVAHELMPNVSAPLRPITIKLFIDLVNCLLSLPNHVNSLNYIHKLPLTAKRILYPGVMNKSWLKSVNAMHTYPNMLSFLSYLVDFARARDNLAEKMTVETLSGVERHGQLSFLKQVYYLRCWELFQFPTEPDFQPILEDYIQEFKAYHKVSDEEIVTLEEKKKNLLRELNNSELTDGRNREAELKQQTQDIEEKTRQLIQIRSDLERKLKQATNQRNQLRVTVDTNKDVIRRLQQEITETHKSLEEQGMTIRQRDEIIAETDRILTAADSKKELIKELQKMGFKKDLVLCNLQKEALVASNGLNRSLVSVGLMAGMDLSEYTVEQRDLLAGNALSENKEKLMATLSRIRSEGEKRLQAARHNRESGVCRKQQLKILLESERQRFQTIQDELKTCEESSVEMKRAAAEEVAKLRAAGTAARQRTADRRKKMTEVLRKAKEEFEHWQQQDEKWRNRLEQLRSEEDLVKQTCEARALTLINQYVTLSRSVTEY